MSEQNDVLDKEMPGWVAGVVGLFLIGCVVFALSMVLPAIFDGDDSNLSAVATEQEQKKEYDDINVYVSAQMILEDFLKSPSTAEYPAVSSAEIERYKDDAFQVSAYVDSQNGFGATVRSDWNVMFQMVNDNAKPLAVVVDGEVLYKEDSNE